MGIFNRLKNTFFEKAQKLWGGLMPRSEFNQVSVESSSYPEGLIDPCFDYRSFENGVTEALVKNGIKNAVSASATYRIDNQANEYLAKALMFQGLYQEAKIVMSYADNGRAAAYMVGRRADGRYDVTALQNLCNPHDRRYYDKESAEGSVTYFNTVLSLRGQIAHNFVETKYPNEIAQSIHKILFNRPMGAVVHPAYA